MGDVFYIIEEGEAMATKVKEPGKAPEPVLNYKKGGYFGELALIRGEPRAANIVAKVIKFKENNFNNFNDYLYSYLD
jgi:cAMP-dependent protein kinase regulator